MTSARFALWQEEHSVFRVDMQARARYAGFWAQVHEATVPESGLVTGEETPVLVKVLSRC